MYIPNLHRRRSIRLKGYDYSQGGAYFITICTQNRECSFGDIMDGRMGLNDAGQMIERWWNELMGKYPHIKIDAYIVMPNHFHGIIIVGATLCGRPEIINRQPHHQIGQPHRVAPTIGEIIDWFKTMTINEYIRGVKQHNWQPFHGKLWQRNYYDRIIRNEKELNQIREYIFNNPFQWAEDEYNPEKGSQC